MLWLAIVACTSTPRTLSRPNAVAVGPDGAVYVSDFGHDRIVELDADGEVQRVFGRRGLGRGELWRVYALAVDDDGALLVANRRPEDRTSSDGNTWEVKRFEGGKEVGVIPFQGHFTSPSHTMHALDVRPDGSLLVANPAGGELFLLDDQGRYQGAFGGVMRSDAAPHALHVVGDVAWVVDQRSHRLSVVGHDGERTVSLTFGEDGGLSFPSAVAACPEAEGRPGWVAVADLGNHRVQRFDLEGMFLDSFAPPRAGPDQPAQLLSLAVAPDCSRIYVADSKGDRVLVTTPSGEILREVAIVE